jgi:uncharacterized membrane protein YcaP (DUF421 family)
MATVFIRTIIIYLGLIVAIRLLGKRQVGELELSELVITFMLSELATVPILDSSVPISHTLIPVVVLITSEIISSFLVTKSPFIKKLLNGNPSYIIKRGKINQKELSRLRMGLPELLSELRLKDVGDVGDVDYAILEENGKLSVFEKDKSRLAHALVIDGKVIRSNLDLASKDEKWLLAYLKKHKLELKDVFLLTFCDNNNINIIMKETE